MHITVLLLDVLVLSIMTVVACTAGHITVDVSLHVSQLMCHCMCNASNAMGHDPGVEYSELPVKVTNIKGYSYIVIA